MPRHVVRFRYLALCLASLAAGCGTLPAPSTEALPTVTRAPAAGDRAAPVLERSDFAALDVANAAEMIGRLRPEFLRGSGRRPSMGEPEIAVFVNGVYNGEPSTLSMIPAAAINSVMFLQPVNAYARFGPRCRCANGAIVVNVLGSR